MYDYQKIAKALIRNADEIVAAIDRYIAKKDEDLKKTLKTEGYADPDGTVGAINDLEEAVAGILADQQQDLLNTLKEAEEAGDTGEQLKKRIDTMLENDSIQDDVTDAAVSMYDDTVEPLATEYIQEVEPDMQVESLRKRTESWFETWGTTLGELMRLSTHDQITRLIHSAVDDGKDIPWLTRQIMSGGWRNEYYQARRVAVTEVLRAHSVAREEAIQQSPACEEKEWRHTGAHKNTPRPNHVAMDCQIVKKTDPFVMKGKDGNTYYPMYPRDPLLPAGESINCHCIHRGIPSKAVLGYSYEERKKMQQEYISNDDSSWENEGEESSKVTLPPATPGEEPADNEKFDYKSYLIDRKYIASAEYTSKFDGLGETKVVTRRIRAQARKMLRHRSGTWYEDLAFVDTKSNTVMARTDFNAKKRVKPSRKMLKMLKEADDYTVIGIHNHPESGVPSYSDFSVAYKRKYKYGIVACHNGTIYKYSIVGQLNRPIAESALDLLSLSGYSDYVGKLFNDAGIKLEVF